MPLASHGVGRTQVVDVFYNKVVDALVQAPHNTMHNASGAS